MRERLLRMVCVLPAIVIVGLLGGCAVAPNYEDVQSDTVSAAEQIIATFPEDSDVTKRPDSDPYACDSGGYLYTGQWDVTVPEGTDIAALINALPDVLGEDWVVTQGSLPRADDYVDITDTARKVGVSVSVTSSNYPAPTINVYATSACATLASSTP